jgi:hypothetical protein
MLVAVLVVLSACTADTTEGDEDTTATTAPTSEDTAAASEDEKVLRVGVTDDTSDWEAGTSGLPNLEVWMPGTGSWFPDTSFGGDVIEEAGPFPVGEATEIFIYPEGREDPEFAVEVVVDANIIAGSVRDMIQISIDDSTVNVSGAPIPGFEVEFRR